ncbi:MAG: hypothetical protein AAGI88_23580, partial [Pseudomonadota bacterium]
DSYLLDSGLKPIRLFELKIGSDVCPSLLTVFGPGRQRTAHPVTGWCQLRASPYTSRGNDPDGDWTIQEQANGTAVPSAHVVGVMRPTVRESSFDT